MRKQCVWFPTVWVFLLVGQIGQPRAEDENSVMLLDLPTAVTTALLDNPEVQAKRRTLGLAKGRVQQAELLFQTNPLVSIETDYRNRRFREPSGRSTTDATVLLLQEVEIAGQRGHRRQAGRGRVRPHGTGRHRSRQGPWLEELASAPSAEHSQRPVCGAPRW